MTHRHLNLSLGALLLVAGCSQLIGLSDYEIDPPLDGAAGDAQAGEGGADGGGSPSGGAPGHAGESGQSQGGDPVTSGGDPNLPQGGQPPGQGGDTGASGAGGAPSPRLDCDSIECCEDVGGRVIETELLVGGDFETNRTRWDGYYVVNDDLEVFSKATNDSIPAHSGVWYAWLGGVSSDTAVLDSPAFVIPPGTQWVGFTGQRFFAFDSPTLTGDFTLIGLYEPGAADATELFDLWDNFAFDTDDWEPMSYPDIPAAHLVGNTYVITAFGVTDDQFDNGDEQEASNFFYDDFSFKAYRCAAN